MTYHASRASEHMTDTFIVVRGESTLRSALIELEAQGGQEWWFLVVLTGEPEKLLAAPFREFRKLLEDDERLLEKSLADVDFPLSPTEWIGPDADLTVAYSKAADNHHGLVLIAEESDRAGSRVAANLRILGVIHVGSRQAMATPGGGSLFDLLSRSVLPRAPTDSKMEASRKAMDFVGAEPQESMISSDVARSVSDPFTKTELEESMLEEAPPPRSTGAPPDKEEREEPAEEINVSVGGDVSEGGTINVAGRDIVYNVLSPAKQTKDQDRRFEAAFPREAQRDETYDLWVVVALPDAPPFFTDEQEANIVEEKPDSAVSVEFEVDRVTGELKPAEVEVRVTGDGFEIVGTSSRLLTVYPDGTPDKRRFLVKALETGKQRLIIEYMQDGKLLKEMTIVAEVYAPEKKPAGGLNLSFQVVIFGARLSFATGGGA